MLERKEYVSHKGRRKSRFDRYLSQKLPQLDSLQHTHHRSPSPDAREQTSLVILCHLQLNSTRDTGLDCKPDPSKVIVSILSHIRLGSPNLK